MVAPRSPDDASVKLLVLVGVLTGAALGAVAAILLLDDLEQAFASIGYA